MAAKKYVVGYLSVTQSETVQHVAQEVILALERVSHDGAVAIYCCDRISPGELTRSIPDASWGFTSTTNNQVPNTNTDPLTPG